MNQSILLLLIFTLINNPKIIYGDLDYIEIEELENKSNTIDWYNKSKSVAVIIPRKQLIQISKDEFRINTITLKEEIENINTQHQFKDQISVGIGTGFLVAPNKLLTAGHLVRDIKKSVLVFDYQWDSSNGKLWKEIYAKEEIYHLKKVLSKCNSKKGDYALIEIDKAIENRTFLKIADFKEKERLEVKMISCPDGTPLKLTNKGQIWKKNPRIEGLSNKGYFFHNLDNSGGSSGAPIFDSQTGKVIGIQSGGDDNYLEKEGITYQVKGDDDGLNTNIGRNLSGEYGSKLPQKLIEKIKHMPKKD